MTHTSSAFSIIIYHMPCLDVGFGFVSVPNTIITSDSELFDCNIVTAYDTGTQCTFHNCPCLDVGFGFVSDFSRSKYYY